jgi:hypothetical protein
MRIEEADLMFQRIVARKELQHLLSIRNGWHSRFSIEDVRPDIRRSRYEEKCNPSNVQ